MTETVAPLVIIPRAHDIGGFEVRRALPSAQNGRIEQAKSDWEAQRFARVPGDDAEFIPLPAARV